MRIFPFAAILFLSACGGDGDSDSDNSTIDATTTDAGVIETQVFSVVNTSWKSCVASPGVNSPVDGIPLPYNGVTLTFTETDHRQVTGCWDNSECLGDPIESATTILSGTYEIGGTRMSTEGFTVHDVTYIESFEGLGIDPLPRDDILFLDNGTLFLGFGRFDNTVPSINLNLPLTPST